LTIRPRDRDARLRVCPEARIGAGCHDDRVATTLLIVDDHAGFRAFARALMEAEGLDVVGEAEDGESALAQAVRLDPDVVLLDVMLPGLDGFEVCDRLTALTTRRPAIVLTSSRDASSYADRLARSSACGFVAKHALSAATLLALTEGAP
jgi:DNA-binding NarL/FixJ family response regulator